MATSSLVTRSTSVDPAWFVREMEAQIAAESYASVDDVVTVAGHIGNAWDSRPRLARSVGPTIGVGEPGSFEWSISPGVVALRTRSAPGTEEIESEISQGVLFELEDEPSTRSAITEWSRASRARMHRMIGELDYSGWHLDGGVLAMVTLTLPGSWQAVAPTGRDFKRLIEVFRMRWIRQVKTPWRGLWKLEFQRRGAPHLHALMRVPATVKGQRFELWLSKTWADICKAAVMKRLDDLPEDEEAYIRVIQQVDAYEDGDYEKHLAAGTAVDFSGVKFSDPRRTAIYFGKHASKVSDSKEYQHIVPEDWRGEGAGPGRFWGVWGLERAVATMTLTRDEFVRAKRILRHVARSRKAVTDMSRRRATGESVWAMKRHRVPGLGSRGGGWVLVNDGLALALDVARALRREVHVPINLA